jgi:hypothetical protein
MSMVAMARPAPLTMQPMRFAERHVIEVVPRPDSFSSSWSSAQRDDVGAVERVVVEAHLGVETDESLAWSRPAD